MLEEFIRQSRHIIGKPVVVISQSDTPNWHEPQCKQAAEYYNLTSADVDLIKNLNKGTPGVEHLVTGRNKFLLDVWGRNVLRLLSQYPEAAIQLFKHSG